MTEQDRKRALELVGEIMVYAEDNRRGKVLRTWYSALLVKHYAELRALLESAT